MDIQSLSPAENSRFSQKRLGRGIGSGLGYGGCGGFATV